MTNAKEIKAAHPKCGTCENRKWDRSAERDSCSANGIWVELTDYCNKHTELTNQPKENEE